MGHIVAKVLIHHGMPVITCLEERSEQSRERAVAAGIEEVSTLAEVVQQADLFLSILPPVFAHDMAQKVIATGEKITYVDCNAVSPKTAIGIGQALAAEGCNMVDAGIIGPPPSREGMTRFYASGEQMELFTALGDFGLDIRVVGSNIGQASGFKMCYAAQTKGRYAIFIESLVAAQRLGCYERLVEELKLSQGATYAETENTVPNIPSKSKRWIAEMEEIAATFAELNMTENVFHGVADIYRAIAATEPGALHGLPLDQLIERLATGME